MRAAALTYICLFVILASCKTSQPVAPEPALFPDDEKVKGILRGFLMKEHDWMVADPEASKTKIGEIMKDCSEANFNLAICFADQSNFCVKNPLLINQPQETREGAGIFNPWPAIVHAAHKNDLRIYVGIDLLNLSRWCMMDDEDSLSGNSNSPFSNFELQHTASDTNSVTDLIAALLSDATFPVLKTKIKSCLKDFIEINDIDGIQFDITDLLEGLEMTRNSEEYDSDSEKKSIDGFQLNTNYSRIKDMLEDLVAEVMLVKPYLVNSLSFTSDVNPFLPVMCLEEGLVDFISPEFDTNEAESFDAFFDYCQENGNDPHLIARMLPTFNLGSGQDLPIARYFDDVIYPTVSPGFILNINLADSAEIKPPQFLDPYFGLPDIPMNLKKISTEQVVGLNISTLFSGPISGREVKLLNGSKTKFTDSEGNIGVIIPVIDTMDLVTSDRSIVLKTAQWSLPFRYKLNSNYEAVRISPWVEFRRMPSKHTYNSEFHLLCKTDYPAMAYINGNLVKVYQTGIFFDKIDLKEGSNRVRASITTPDSLKAFYEEEFFHEKVNRLRSAFPLWIDENTVSLADELEFVPEDMIRVGFQGSLGQQAFVEIYPSGLVFECDRKDHTDYSEYQADIPARKFKSGEYQQLILRLVTSEDSVKNQIFDLPLSNRIIVKQLDEFPLVRVVQENSRLTYNTGPVRLGGPIRAELNPGVILKVDGREGEYYRIRLNEMEKGYIHQENVEVMPPETNRPFYYISSISCSPTDKGDLVSIPYPQPVPFEIYPEPDQKRIVITLFGVKTSSTWITHRKGRRMVDKITWQQTSPETYQIYVNLKTSKIWGYDLRVEDKLLVLQVKYPPDVESPTGKVLSGLKIAIEAGHGGESTGALGLSGLLEKDINLDLALKLEGICRDRGAEVLQVRPSDTTMMLLDKRKIAVTSDADMLISIHANAAGVSRGYLTVPGTSTYYNNPFWAPLAEKIYNQLLGLGLAEFGVVGSFNYTVIRVTQMPSILVEQAFMTHAEDEEKLADPQFRQLMAQKIYEGILDFLTYMGEEQ